MDANRKEFEALWNNDAELPERPASWSIYKLNAWAGYQAAKANTADQLRAVAIAVREAALQACYGSIYSEMQSPRTKNVSEIAEDIHSLDIDSILKGM